jgi:hypothetical protein
LYTLITAANSSEAYRLKSTLDLANILLGDYLELPNVLLKSGKVLKLPHPERASYTHEMLSLCLDKDIDTIYPLREQERQLLLNSRQLFHEYNISIKVVENEI